MTTTKSYDFLNRLTQISSVPSASSAVSSGYAYNSANQRTAVTNAESARWVYQYDSLGQVISGKKYWSDGTPVAGQQFEYAFDDIGNRKTAASGGDQYGANLRHQNYTANNLNQYTQRTVPGSVDVIGTATNAATVTVNNHATYRKAEYYRADLSVSNSAAPAYISVTNLAVLQNGSNPDISTNFVGNMFLPKTPELFSYDADGNLTNDGRWLFTWNAENRLIQMISTNVPDSAKRKLDFVYDAQGRRIRKTMHTWNGLLWVVSSDVKFAYDGWNLLAELNATNNAVTRSFMWGSDLSGASQGAGGVGGLLAVDTGTGVHFVAYDGNGNVAGLVSTADGTTTANYEYGPFGESIRATGSAAKPNPFRFK